MNIIAVDPGLKGAFATSHCGLIEAWPMPLAGKIRRTNKRKVKEAEEAIA